MVPENVCVATRAQIGAGAVNLFDGDHGGADVDWEDVPQAPKGTPRVVVDADIGIGALEVSHTDFGSGWGQNAFAADSAGNRACLGAVS